MMSPLKRGNQAKTIPKIIHQIWFNFKNWGQVQKVPHKYRRYQRKLLQYNPSWTIQSWDEEQADEFLRTQYPKWNAKMMSFSAPIQRADFFRWCALYHFGGCYVDMDCRCKAAIESCFPSQSGPLLMVPNSMWATNAMIVATPLNPIMFQLIEEMSPCSRFGSSNSVIGIFYSTGPSFITNFLAKHPSASTIFSDKMLWHAPCGSSKPVRYVVQHKGDGGWNFNTFLAFDILKMLTLLILIGLSLVFIFRLLRRKQTAS